MYALEAFTAADNKLDVSNEHVTLNRDVHIVNDMSRIEGLQGRPFIPGNPHMKFYAAVPIRSQTGVIGIYCVVDQEMRHGLGQDGFESLTDLATAIVQHLELLKNQYDLERSRGMVQGLGLFVEGKSGWGERPQIGQPRSYQPTPKPSPPPPLSQGQEDIASRAPNAPIFPDQPTNAMLPGVSGARAVARKRTSSSASLGPRERKLSVDDAAVESLYPSGTMELFSRASTLIRQAIGLDGVMFLDGGFGRGVVDLFQPVSKVASPEGSPPKGLKARSTTPQNEPNLMLSELLGSSIREAPDRTSTLASSRQRTLSRMTLRALLKEYWQGLIFFFNEDCTLSGVRKAGEHITDENTATFQEFQEDTKKSWLRQILDICPGSRTLIFFPLWDPQRDRWSIGGLAWSNSPSGVLQPHDITYLTAFGRCIMTEKSRLDAISADRAKSNFISSVSHELRSPLHGVLASAEALQETATSFAQDDLIRTITVCGEVLLDTTDQM